MSNSRRYVQLRDLGSNAYGTVHEAYDRHLQEKVAVLELRQEFFEQDDAAWEQLVVQAKIGHKGIVDVIDNDPQLRWIVMPLMPSCLASRLANDPLPHKEVRRVLRECLEALEYLHSKDCIHGDIRPATILEDSHGAFKLAFPIGIALNGDIPLHSKKYKYMSPELIDPKFGYIGPALDLYCLGFTALELLVGPEFDKLLQVQEVGGHDAWSGVHGSDSAIPPTLQLAPGTPEDIARTIDRLLEKRVEDRFAEASSALSELDEDDSLDEEMMVPSPNSRKSTFSNFVESPKAVATVAGGAILVTIFLIIVQKTVFQRESVSPKTPSDATVSNALAKSGQDQAVGAEGSLSSNRQQNGMMALDESQVVELLTKIDRNLTHLSSQFGQFQRQLGSNLNSQADALRGVQDELSSLSETVMTEELLAETLQEKQSVANPLSDERSTDLSRQIAELETNLLASLKSLESVLRQSSLASSQGQADPQLLHDDSEGRESNSGTEGLTQEDETGDVSRSSSQAVLQTLLAIQEQLAQISDLILTEDRLLTLMRNPPSSSAPVIPAIEGESLDASRRPVGTDHQLLEAIYSLQELLAEMQKTSPSGDSDEISLPLDGDELDLTQLVERIEALESKVFDELSLLKQDLVRGSVEPDQSPDGAHPPDGELSLSGNDSDDSAVVSNDSNDELSGPVVADDITDSETAEGDSRAGTVDRVDLLTSQASMKIWQKDFQGAVADIESLMEIRPSLPDFLQKMRAAAYIGRGQEFYQEESYSKAIDDFTSAIELDIPRRDLAMALRYRAASHAMLDDTQTALADLDKAESLGLGPQREWPQAAERLAVWGEHQFDDGEYSEGIKSFSAALQLDSRSAKAWCLRGRTQYEVGEPAKALPDLDRGLELAREQGISSSSNLYLSTLFRRGRVRLDLGMNWQAIDDFSEVLSESPDHLMANIFRGIARVRTSDFSDALNDFDVAIRLDPLSYVAYNNRGACYLHMEEYEKAISDLTYAIAVNDKTPSPYFNRYLAYKAISEPDKAKLDWYRFMQVDGE